MRLMTKQERVPDYLYVEMIDKLGETKEVRVHKLDDWEYEYGGPEGRHIIVRSFSAPVGDKTRRVVREYIKTPEEKADVDLEIARRKDLNAKEMQKRHLNSRHGRQQQLAAAAVHAAIERLQTAAAEAPTSRARKATRTTEEA